jgi:flagellar hook-basal body complex protein FliE
MDKFLTGDTDLHSVMMALEKADVSFQMMMQVRNKIVAAYQDIMKTQV